MTLSDTIDELVTQCGRRDVLREIASLLDDGSSPLDEVIDQYFCEQDLRSLIADLLDYSYAKLLPSVRDEHLEHSDPFERPFQGAVLKAVETWFSCELKVIRENDPTFQVEIIPSERVHPLEKLSESG